MTNYKEAAHSNDETLGINLSDKSWKYDEFGKLNIGKSKFLDPLPGHIQISEHGRKVDWIGDFDGSIEEKERQLKKMRQDYVACVVPFHALLEIYESKNELTVADLDLLLEKGEANDLFSGTPVVPEEHSQTTIIIKRRGAGLTNDVIRLNLRNKRNICDVEPVITEADVNTRVGACVKIEPLLSQGLGMLYITPLDDHHVEGWSNVLHIDGVMPRVQDHDGLKMMSSYGAVSEPKIVISKSKAKDGDVIVVRASGKSNGKTSDRFGVTNQGIFCPAEDVEIVPRKVGSLSDLRGKSYVDYVNDSSFVTIQWVGGDPRNARDVVVVEFVQFPDGSIGMDILSGTDLGRMEMGSIRNSPVVVPVMPMRPDQPHEKEIFTREEPKLKVSKVADPVSREAIARMLELAHLWGIELPARNSGVAHKQKSMLEY